MSEDGPPSRALIVLSFVSLYLIWGSTYLGIKIAIDTMPPFLMATSRFFIAGLILYAVARLRGVARPDRKQWRHAFVVGALLIAGGNGIVTFAEKWIDSSMAALFIASSPLFITLFSWWGGVQKKPSLAIWISLVGGFLGVGVLLIGSSELEASGFAFSALLVLLAVVSWAVGVVYSKRNALEINPWIQSGMQMICGGGVCLVLGVLLGEFETVEITQVSFRSWVAFGYLVIAGSLAGFTSYVYLLRHCSPTSVSSHAYVNPVVAVVLGWIVLSETLSAAAGLGAGMILVSVFILLRRK